MKRLLALTVALPLMVGACAQPASGEMSKKEIEQIVKSYLMENPQVVEEALIELDRIRLAEKLDDARDALENDPRDIAMGPEDAKVTIVEFFDYNCGYCKQSTEWVRSTLKKYPDDVRVVFKELPILDSRSKTSRSAAIAALAAARQGKYPVMHFSLMAESNLAPERVEALAKKAGLDIEMWKQDMKDDKFAEQLEDVMALARQMPDLTGTPYFVIGNETVAGANVARLEEILEDALKS